MKRPQDYVVRSGKMADMEKTVLTEEFIPWRSPEEGAHHTMQGHMREEAERTRRKQGPES